MPQRDKYILIIGCFDTKGEEFHFLYNALLDLGEQVLTINTGIRGTTDLFKVDYEADVVSSEVGESIQKLREKGDRGYAIKKMGLGAASLIAKLVSNVSIKGAIGMGGGGGTYIALSAMQSIPFGVPKVCLSTLAAKDLSRQIGSKDIMLIPSIVDVAGLNSILKRLILQAASAISAMANVIFIDDKAVKGKIAISMFGNTTACVNICSEILKNEGYEVFAFHATGVGGMTMESLIRENFFDAVLDITTTELADDLCGGILSAGPNRLEAAADMGIPQVVAPGCLDMVNFGQKDTVPLKYQSRNLYSWAPDVTLMRTDENENRILGRKLIEKINKSAAASIVLLPLKGISQLSSEGGVFYNPEVDHILFETIKKYAIDSVVVREVDAQINDIGFAELAVTSLLTILEEHKRKSNTNH
ncbi:MAG TPA: Tm-1-like ATP-binding domain-containing protein, partial [Anditalea sp.]|nr:Tm-1-like ATP-binding domain-containing protein [Anditalea sp.]